MMQRKANAPETTKVSQHIYSARATTHLRVLSPELGGASIPFSPVLARSPHDRGPLAAPTSWPTEDDLASRLMVKVKEPHGEQTRTYAPEGNFETRRLRVRI